MAGKKGAARKPREATPKDETKRAKFVRLVNKRVSKALKAVKIVGNLSGSGYEYGEDDVRKIRDAIGKEVNAMLQRFAPRSKAEAGGGFSIEQDAA